MALNGWMQARHILVVRLDNLGDVLVTSPAFGAIKETSPGARVKLLASPVGAQAASILPAIDDVIVFDAPWMDVSRTLPQRPEREFAMVEDLQRREVDGVIIFTSYHQSSLLPFPFRSR